MKKLLILLMVLIPTLLSAQTTIDYPWVGVEYLQVTLDSTDTDTVWCLFDPIRGTKYSMSETRPTFSSPVTVRQEFQATGDEYLAVRLVPVTAEESDSLSAYIKPVVYDLPSLTYRVVKNDSTFLVFDTQGTYTSTTVDWLDWTSGYTYGVCLSGELWSTCGYVLIFKQKAAGTPGADATATVIRYKVR